MTQTIIGLGSNLGNRDGYLTNAILKLNNIMQVLQTSSIYESPAMLPENAPDSWNTSFLNMALLAETELNVYALLDAIKTIETELGRQKTERWGPREIDIDILTFGNEVIDDNRVNIPHPGLLQRAFVLRPICDIAPYFIYPRPGLFYQKSLSEIAAIIHSDSNTECKIYISNHPKS